MSDESSQKSVQQIQDSGHEAAKAETAPAPVRRSQSSVFEYSLWLITTAFAVLTVLVVAIPSQTVDLRITTAIQSIHSPFFTFLMNLISWPGYNPQSIIITALVVVMIYILGLHWEALVAFAAAVLSTSANIMVKELVQRPRPGPDQVNVFAILDSYSFPSGHVMFYLGFLGFLWFLVFSLLKHSFKRSLLLVLLGSLVILIGFSRIYLGEHWASDVLGSYLLGSLTLVAIIRLYQWGKPRFGGRSDSE